MVGRARGFVVLLMLVVLGVPAPASGVSGDLIVTLLSGDPATEATRLLPPMGKTRKLPAAIQRVAAHQVAGTKIGTGTAVDADIAILDRTSPVPRLSR